MKLKKIFCAVALSAAVAMGMCGYGNEKSEAKFVEAEKKNESAASTFKKSEGNASEAVVKDMIASMVKVEAGSFRRGEQQVRISKDFYIGKYEVTQRLWQIVMGNNPSKFEGDNRPVECVSWNEAMAFCKKLNESGKAPKGWKFTLPTAAQWEFAARGGNKSKGHEYSGSNDIKEVAWYYDNSDATHDVGEKKPNELGLYDMSGNVWEWCLDISGGYGDKKEVTDPTGPQDGSNRVLRGGSWGSSAGYCRVADRGSYNPDNRDNNFGFRLALVPVQ